jgi:hypothetical protein
VTVITAGGERLADDAEMIHRSPATRHRARWSIRLALLGLTLAAVELVSNVTAETARSAVAEAGRDSTAPKTLDDSGL